MYRLFDHPTTAGTPTLDEFMAFVHPEDRDELMQSYREIAASGTPFEVTFRSNPERGPVLHFLARAKANPSDDGAVHTISGATQDISAQIRARDEQDALEEKLRQSQKLEALGQLTGGIAHDFNNILHALLGFCSLAQTAAPDDRATLSDCLENIEIAAKRAAALVRQLLTFSRGEQMKRSPIAVAPVIEEGLKLVRSTLPATIAIQHTCHDQGLTVVADPTQIHQIVLNLCTNAAHAMPQGGVLEVSICKVALRKPTLMNTGEILPGDYIRLSIADTGSGIRPDVAPRIFDPFFTTKETGRGTGLGLTTVHGIVVSMDGAINVETQLGKGTTFHVFLKQCTDFPDTTSPIPEEDQSSVPLSGRVLLVDDEKAIVKLARRAISRRGVAVDAFSHPAEALAAFTENPDDYAILVTDLTMPGMTGVELARKVRAIRADIPVLLLSGHLEKEDVPTSLVTQVLQKPVNLSQLIATIESYGSQPTESH